ncbi:MAG: hypothetical protein HY531_03510 [Chloroflexi bacterium]|nr:hypothetical protein [Chloroflexota bacterium]
MITDNRISTIPKPVGSVRGGTCTDATNNMVAFPDSTSNVVNGGKVTDPSEKKYTNPGDKTGYTLFGHDIEGNNTQVTTALINYVNRATIQFYYTVESSGTVHQCASANGAEINS